MSKDEALKDRIGDIVAEPLKRENCELADIKISRYKHNVTLRLFVYGEGGVDLARCAHLSRLIGDRLDAEQVFDDAYTLEVSSPGLDRPLVTARDFHYRAGETVRVSFADRKRKKITAEIVSATDDAVTFSADAETFTVPLAEIDQAKIVF